MAGEDLCSYINLHFYNAAGVRQNARLQEAKGLSFTDELQADGAASYSASLLADTFDVVPDLLEGPGYCKAAMVLTAGAAPVEVFGWELVPTSGTVIAVEGQEEIVPTAPGLRNILNRAQVDPESGTWDKNTEDARAFGWMSYPSAYWYDAGDWSTPGTHGPEKFPGGVSAEKITADTTPAVGDVMLFRTAFTLTSAAAVRISWMCDDEGSLWADSKLADTSQSANQIQSITLGLSAGTHNIAAEVTNTIQPECGFAAVVTNLTTGTVIRKTDVTNWVTHKVVGGAKPGMSAGAIIRTLLDEAVAANQDAEGLDLLTTDFDGLEDSDGSFWTVLQEVAFPIGTPLGEVVRHLEELGCDVHIKPDFTLQAFIEQGTDVSATVLFVEGANLLGLTYQGTPVRGTITRVRTLGGWATVSNGAGVTAYGKRYLTVVSGTSASTAQGARLGGRALEETASPRYTYTATIVATTGRVPFLSFKKGDLVTCPDRVKEPTVMRVLSISASTPSDTAGPVTFTIELDLP